MSKETSRRLVLGFDAGCMTCSDLAREIENKVGDKLEVANLRDPQVMEWRKETLGEDAPWAPALFEVNGEAVKAWTGKRMGLKLGRALGPVATWRVMQVLGEVGATPEVIEASSVARIGSGMSRGQFLKGVGGAAVAMGVLSATGELPSSAQAASKPRKVTGDQLIRLARRAAASKDVEVVGGKEWSRITSVTKSCQNGECVAVVGFGGNTNCRVQQINGETTVTGNCAIVRATKLKLKRREVTTVVFEKPNGRFLIYDEYDRPQRGLRTQAYLYEQNPENDRRFRLVAASDNGKRWEIIPDAPISRSSGEALYTAQGCYVNGCADVDFTCLYRSALFASVCGGVAVAPTPGARFLAVLGCFGSGGLLAENALQTGCCYDRTRRYCEYGQCLTQCT